MKSKALGHSRRVNEAYTKRDLEDLVLLRGAELHDSARSRHAENEGEGNEAPSAGDSTALIFPS